jgi:hypothetical protein
MTENDRIVCRKCGGADPRIQYIAHCPRRDCDHKYCGDRLRVTCSVCGFTYERRPLDVPTTSPGGCSDD